MRRFAKLLSQTGLDIEERSYSIRVNECECLTFEFDRNTEDEATIEGTAATDRVLRADAHRVHEVLTLAGVRHWLQITDSVQNELEYLHHMWPEDQGS
jgi:hypothetical protein